MLRYATTCRSYHLRISVHRYILLFFVIMLLLAHLSFVANSPLNAVFTFTLPCLSTVFRTRSSITLPASSKNRSGSMWENLSLTLSIYKSQTLFRSRAIEVYIRHSHARVVHALNPSNSRVSRYMWLLIVSCRSTIASVWHDSSRYSIVPMRRTLLWYSVGLLALSNHPPCYRLHWLMTRCV